jgi:hypothetical protein
MAIWGKSFFKRYKAGIKALAMTGIVFMILLIAFTRLYLGVHFPTDILAGWVLGGISLGLYFLTEKRLSALFSSTGRRPRNICLGLAVLLMIAVYTGGRVISAMFFGFGLGYSLMRFSFPFAARRTAGSRLPRPGVLGLRFLLGFLGVMGLYLGLLLVLPGEGSLFAGFSQWGASSPYYDLGQFVCHSLLGLWISAGAPRIFLRMGLAGPPETEA